MVLCPQEKECYYINNLMRMLWEDHVAWTRMTIISIAESLPDEALVTQRLLRNPVDFAAAFQPLYGPEIAARLKDLLTEHLVTAAQLVKAAKAGDSAAVEDAEKRWYANADEIATFLNCINPYWSKELMRKMWHEHLDLVKAQAVARLKKDYASDIVFYDQGRKLVLEMADEFTRGIIRQFPCFLMVME